MHVTWLVPHLQQVTVSHGWCQSRYKHVTCVVPHAEHHFPAHDVVNHCLEFGVVQHLQHVMVSHRVVSVTVYAWNERCAPLSTRNGVTQVVSLMIWHVTCVVPHLQNVMVSVVSVTVYACNMRCDLPSTRNGVIRVMSVTV